MAFYMLSTGFLLALVYPLNEALIRWRADFTPIGDASNEPSDDEEAAPLTGAVEVAPRLRAKSWFGMLKRVNEMEGLDGHYRGFMPTLASFLFWQQISLPAILIIGYLHIGDYTTSDLLVFAVAGTFRAIGSAIESVFVDRAITTREELPSFSFKRAFDALLTAKERRQPYMLLFIPGLLLSHFVWTLWIIGTCAARHFLVLWLLPTKEEPKNFKEILVFVPLILGTVIASVVLNTLFLTPLEVTMVRLAIQGKSMEAVPQTAMLLEDAIDTENTSTQSDEVIQLRKGDKPYIGLIDCIRRIKQEEGWGVLYRGWGWTAFRGLLFL
ncbi:hypothetical protein HYDPIDRAFT_36189 [Hydnomerulius pinastri MD-312]|nr:hypothetical protein HYDPIDRAFT_36189 [Hydnomerulius pinastri MD-312]